MLQKIKSLFNRVPVIGVTKRNFLMISADVKKGSVIISYKGRVKSGLFTDRTLHNMMTASSQEKFDKNVGEFLTAVAKLINEVR